MQRRQHTLVTAVALASSLCLGAAPAFAQPNLSQPIQRTAPSRPALTIAEDELLGPVIPVGFVAREPFVGKRRIRFLIKRPSAAARELVESIISNSSGLTTKDVKRLRKTLEGSIRSQKKYLNKWYKDPKVRGVFAHLVYSDHTPTETVSVTFSPIR